MGWKDFLNRSKQRSTEQDDALTIPESGRYGVETVIVGSHRPVSVDVSERSVNEALMEGGIDFDLAGESFRPGYPDNLLRLAGTLQPMQGPEWPTALLMRDPKNEYDRNAIEVHVVGLGHVGFVAKELASVFAPMMDAGDQLAGAAIEVRVNDEYPDRPGLTVTAWKA